MSFPLMNSPRAPMPPWLAKESRRFVTRLRRSIFLRRPWMNGDRCTLCLGPMPDGEPYYALSYKDQVIPERSSRDEFLTVESMGIAIRLSKCCSVKHAMICAREYMGPLQIALWTSSADYDLSIGGVCIRCGVTIGTRLIHRVLSLIMERDGARI